MRRTSRKASKKKKSGREHLVEEITGEKGLQSLTPTTNVARYGKGWTNPTILPVHGKVFCGRSRVV